MIKITKSIRLRNKHIRKAGSLTRAKRKLQTCKVFEVKIDKSHLNLKTKEHLNRLFLESKWFYNYILSQESIFELANFDKLDKVPVKVKGTYLNRRLKFLSSHMKQSILERTKNNIIALARMKEKGIKVGALDFKSFVNSVPLVQYGNTYKILDKN